jgi:hypothetical protein
VDASGVTSAGHKQLQQPELRPTVVGPEVGFAVQLLKTLLRAKC